MSFNKSSDGIIIGRRTALKLAGASTLMAISGAHFAAPARADTPQRGGTLKIAMSQGSTTESLDPTTYLDTHMFFIGFALGNALVEIGPDRAPKPELAESWEGSPDAKIWTFKIRKGVQFHNGKELTPQDVVYSLSRHIGPDSTSAAKGFLANVSSIRAEGDTVVIELSAGDADIPIIMGDFHLQIVPEGFTDWNNFVGTGPYVLESFRAGETFRATRNPNYWKPDRAWVDAVEVVFVPDVTARMNALVSGDVNVIDRVDGKAIHLLKRLNKFNIVEGVGGRYETSVMDVRNGPLNDANVRLALKYAMNRQELVDKIFQGYGSVGNDHPIPSVDPFFHSELPQREYDPDMARSLLKKAGLDGLKIDLSAADAAFPGAVDAATLMQAAGTAAGIDINVIREPNDAYWDNVWMKKSYCMSNWSTRPTPGMMFSVAFACGAPWAEAFWCNDQFEQLLAAGKVETDFAKRKQIYWDMQEIVSNDGGNAVFAFPTDLDAYDMRIMGTAPDGANRLMGARAAERVWFA